MNLIKRFLIPVSLLVGLLIVDIKYGGNYVHGETIEKKINYELMMTSVNSEHSGTEIEKAFDNDINTYWDSAWYEGDKGLGETPIKIQIDFNSPKRLSKLEYLPRQDDNPNGMILKYELFGINKYGNTSTIVSNGRFDNNHSMKSVKISSNDYYQSLILEIEEGSYLNSTSQTHAAIAELNIYESQSIDSNVISKAIKVGETLSLNTENVRFTQWMSSNPSVITVDKAGKIFAQNEGSASITGITANGIKKKYDISVSDYKAPEIPGKKIVFEDNFDGEHLDMSKWSNWNVDLKESDLFRYGNSPEVIVHPNNVKVSEGTLRLLASKEETLFEGVKSQYRSGTVHTREKFESKYGYIVAKVRIPDVAGSNPAIWMMPQRNELNTEWLWGDKENIGAEIDILERPHPDGAKEYSNLKDKYWITMHYDNYLYNLHDKFHVQPTLLNPYEWHEFGIEWTEKSIKFLLDGKVVAVQNENIPNQPEIFILSYGLGGWIGKIDDNRLPQEMEVDYVRWYQ
ncbi:family 16 glycosylhydrolase [Enterococcus gallinarum]|uniref:Family 16 glycosylhydrolase n=1 Tax=Enterococcus gallinarum TaxID=1353 RepID=A0AAE4KZG3_ENTGA|nr:family 16 glycosylhydrolase [Enterococcus gallinarum]MDT2681196.1 family 16 glycosylhydrolase [Enterococcus gallinarum]MDT2691972.1 family 16 glycosylhydrolase [Enterococcus gallinarum]